MRVKYDYKVELLDKEGKVVWTDWKKSKKDWLEDYEDRLYSFYDLKGRMDETNGCGYIECEDGSVVSYTRQVRGEN